MAKNAFVVRAPFSVTQPDGTVVAAGGTVILEDDALRANRHKVEPVDSAGAAAIAAFRTDTSIFTQSTIGVR